MKKILILVVLFLIVSTGTLFADQVVLEVLNGGYYQVTLGIKMHGKYIVDERFQSDARSVILYEGDIDMNYCLIRVSVERTIVGVPMLIRILVYKESYIYSTSTDSWGEEAYIDFGIKSENKTGEK